MLKTVLDHQKTTVKSENLPIGFGGVSLLRRSGVCLCGISKLSILHNYSNYKFKRLLVSIYIGNISFNNIFTSEHAVEAK